jgi:hypothetical protein
VEDARGQRPEVVGVELRGRRAEMRQVEPLGQLVDRRPQLHRVRRAEPRHQRQERHRLDAARAQVAERERAEALGQRLALRAGQERVVREGGGVPPSARMIWICVAVFVTWSAPRTMWVTPMSMSSTTEAKV